MTCDATATPWAHETQSPWRRYRALAEGCGTSRPHSQSGSSVSTPSSSVWIRASTPACGPAMCCLGVSPVGEGERGVVTRGGRGAVTNRLYLVVDVLSGSADTCLLCQSGDLVEEFLIQLQRKRLEPHVK